MLTSVWTAVHVLMCAQPALYQWNKLLINLFLFF
jgi:hypothetical protein